MCRIRLLASKFVQYFLKRKLCLICRLSFIQIGWRLSSACQSVYRINSDLFSLFLNFHTFLRWRQEAVLVWRQRQALYRHSISKKKKSEAFGVSIHEENCTFNFCNTDKNVK
jgi:hypothetical protein